MTRLTAILIAQDPEVYSSSYGPINGKFGLYIGTLEETPSGCKRPRDLLTSEPIYDSAAAAQGAGDSIIASVKAEGM